MINTIRNKLLTYKDTVNSIYVEDEILFALNPDSCECEHSPFIEPHHKHITTGDLRIAGNSKLYKLLTKVPNPREPTIIYKIFETNPSFQVKKHTTRKVQFLFFHRFLLVLTKLAFRKED